MQFTQLIALLGLLLTSQIAVADRPHYYPKFFDHLGTVSQINLSKQTIVINDAKFKLSDNVRTHSLRSEFASLSSITVGSKVGINYIATHNQYLVTNIWQLPSNQPVIPLPTHL